MKKAMMLLTIILMEQMIFGNGLTKQEIELELGSKELYTKAEVVILLMDWQTIFLEEITSLENQIVELNQTNIEKLKELCNKEVNRIGSDRDFYKYIAIGECGIIIAETIIIIVQAVTR